eukprot:952831-Pyramimonas_sp.AAC.1
MEAPCTRPGWPPWSWSAAESHRPNASPDTTCSWAEYSVLCGRPTRKAFGSLGPGDPSQTRGYTLTRPSTGFWMTGRDADTTPT